MGSKVSCESYNACANARKKQMRFPADRNSLYAQGLYDNQMADRSCYEKGPIDYVEGFNCLGFRNLPWTTILKWIVGILLVVLIVMLVQNREEIKLDIETPQAPASPIIPPAGTEGI